MDILYHNEFNRRYDEKTRTYSFPKYEIRKVDIARKPKNYLNFTLEGIDEKGESKRIFFEFPANFFEQKDTK